MATRGRPSNMFQPFNPKQKLGTALVCVCLAWVCAGGERGMPAQDGVGNFGKVNGLLFRGAQPDETGLKSLKQLGVKTIINLRMANDAWPLEEAEARANGMAYFNVPLNGVGRPGDAQVSKVLSIIDSSLDPVFVHCQHGCDRTGTIIACYRIAHDKWSAKEALREAKQFGMSRLERRMKSYVVDFAKAKK